MCAVRHLTAGIDSRDRIPGFSDILQNQANYILQHDAIFRCQRARYPSDEDTKFKT